MAAGALLQSLQEREGAACTQRLVPPCGECGGAQAAARPHHPLDPPNVCWEGSAGRQPNAGEPCRCQGSPPGGAARGPAPYLHLGLSSLHPGLPQIIVIRQRLWQLAHHQAAARAAGRPGAILCMPGGRRAGARRASCRTCLRPGAASAGGRGQSSLHRIRAGRSSSHRWGRHYQGASRAQGAAGRREAKGGEGTPTPHMPTSKKHTGLSNVTEY